MRIIAGKYRGKKLERPKTEAVRPTKDRIRESVFNILGQDMSGLAVLDLFAGSGAYGLEASSRGAKKVVLVENDNGALNVIKNNINSIKAAEECTAVSQDAFRFIKNF